MNFTTLIGAKTLAGSLASFTNYGKVPAEVVLAEAQALIFSFLRVREMRASSLVVLPEQAFTAALPTGYLEAISMRDREGWNVTPDRYISEADLLDRRSYDPDAVTTLNGAVLAAAASIVVASADDFPLSGDFTIKVDDEVMLVTAGHGTTTWTVTRGYAGTAAADHASGATVDGGLEDGTPTYVAVFDELFQFDCKADEARRLDLVYWKSPTLLSADNETNFITLRYPTLLRVGCLAAAARFMKDAEEFQAREVELIRLANLANEESDLGKAV